MNHTNTYQRIDVDLGERSYPIIIGASSLDYTGNLITQNAIRAGRVDGRMVAVITNPSIGKIYGNKLIASLKGAGFNCLPPIHVAPGERYKTLSTVAKIYNHLHDARMDRRGIIIALGGGVIGDTAGFVAASYLRGVDLVQIPTTLLSQVDSSVGGKVGVNFKHVKNSIGAFHQPKLVVIDPNTLSSLSKRELLSGIAEVIKYGAISDSIMFARLLTEAPALVANKSDYLTSAIARSCEIKARIVEQDEHELSGFRATLNFGHTIGHALEAITEFRRYTHGEAIAIGMLSACLIGEKVGIHDQNVTTKIAEILESAGFALKIDADLDINVILTLLAHDKKSVNGSPRFVLLEQVGRATSSHLVPNTIVKDVLEDQRKWISTVK